MRQVYLDHQSATPVREEVLAAMIPFFTESFGNPASFHGQGLRARDAMDAARSQVAELVGAGSPAEILFAATGTEAINLGILGHCRASRDRGAHIVHTQIEHRAVLGCLEALRAEGFRTTAIPPDPDGCVEAGAILGALRPDTILVAVHHANHEIGTIQPIETIAAGTRDRGIPLFVDAVASAGWLPMNVRDWGVPMLALSPHRFGGPRGVGVLYHDRRVSLDKVLYGGDQESGLRPGTENVAAIVGAGLAAKLASRERSRLAASALRQQRRLLDELRRNVPHLRLHGPEPGGHRLPNTLNLSVEFTDGEGLVLLLDARGVSAASGPVCGAKSHPVSHVLNAIGVSPELARSAVTFSLGHKTTASEVTMAARRIADAVSHLRALSPAWDEFQRPRQHDRSAARSPRDRPGGNPRDRRDRV